MLVSEGMISCWLAEISIQQNDATIDKNHLKFYSDVYSEGSVGGQGQA
jgi:hypothetical protein